MDASDILSSKVVQAASVGVVSFAAGGLVGYFLGKRTAKAEEENAQLSFTFETLDEETGETVEYEVVGEIEPNTDPTQFVEGVIEGFTAEDEAAPVIEVPTRTIEWVGPDPRHDPPAVQDYVDISEETPKVTNVFDSVSEGDWDEEAELAARTTEEPFIITTDEFVSNDTGFIQHDLTYYTEDKVLADEHNSPIYNWPDVVGGENLKFGHGSNSGEVVYVRNVKRRAEYQIVRFEGSHERENLGFIAQEELENELRHSEPRRMRRME